MSPSNSSSDVKRTAPASLASPKADEDKTGRHASLEKLVDYLLASKRSLSSTEHVWRANEIVTSARAALEESVVLGSRTAFLRSGVDEQVKLLRRVKDGVDNVSKEAQAEFEVGASSRNGRPL